jgi:hypothetical protein
MFITIYSLIGLDQLTQLVQIISSVHASILPRFALLAITPNNAQIEAGEVSKFKWGISGRYIITIQRDGRAAKQKASVPHTGEMLYCVEPAFKR